MFAGKKSAQIREILISESAWEEMTCLFAPSLINKLNRKKEEPAAAPAPTKEEVLLTEIRDLLKEQNNRS